MPNEIDVEDVKFRFKQQVGITFRLDDLLTEAAFELVERIIEKIDLHKLTSSGVISLMSSCRLADGLDDISNYKVLYYKATDRLQQEIKEEPELLLGLEYKEYKCLK
jgi:hypothetical protein